MGILNESWDSERPDTDEPAEPFLERRAIRPATRELARGALACPDCELPLLPVGRIPIAAALTCPFCGLEERARRFVRLGARDTAANAVQLVARLPG